MLVMILRGKCWFCKRKPDRISNMRTNPYAGGMGRPPGPPATTKTFRIHNDLLEWMEKRATATRSTLTVVVNQVIAEAMEREEREAEPPSKRTKK